MSAPLYRGFNPPGGYPDGGHAGLWYDRFFNKYDSNWVVPVGGKLEWIKTVTSSARAIGGEKVSQFATRRIALIDSLEGKNIVAKTDWRFVSGMGINHPVENGFAWHHTLGVPYLAGAAVKGLLRAWCEQWSSSFAQNLDNVKKADKLREWFGPSIEELLDKTIPAIPAAGNLIFFDAIPTKPVLLQEDVMTPHYGKWYEKGNEPPEADGSNVPADWHDPVPVFFLTVAPDQSFLFSVAARSGCGIDLVSVLEELISALEYLGAGAKTAAGYGRMVEDSEQLETLKDRIQKEKDKEAIRIAEEEAVRQMTSFELELHKVIKENPDSNQKDYVTLLKALDSGRWTDSNIKKVQVAQEIKALMEGDKTWKEASSAKRPEKDRDYQLTLRVLKYLNQ